MNSSALHGATMPPHRRLAMNTHTNLRTIPTTIPTTIVTTITTTIVITLLSPPSPPTSSSPYCHIWLLYLMHVPSIHEDQLTKPFGIVPKMNKVNLQEVLKNSSSAMDIKNGTDMIFYLVSVTKDLILLIFFKNSKDHDSTLNQTRWQFSKQMPTAKPSFCTTHRLKGKNLEKQKRNCSPW